MPDQSPISFRNPETGRMAGLDADLARELARDLGVQVKFVDVPFARVSEQVLQNHCDLGISVLGLTASRGDRLRFTRPHLRGNVCLVVARDNGRIREWADLDRKAAVIAAAKGSVAEAAAREALKSALLLPLETGVDRSREVEAHRADGLLTDCQEAAHLQDGSPWARQITAPAASPARNLAYAWVMAADDDRWYARVEYFVSEVRRDGRLRTAARRYGLEALAIQD